MKEQQRTLILFVANQIQWDTELSHISRFYSTNAGRKNLLSTIIIAFRIELHKTICAFVLVLEFQLCVTKVVLQW